jgi:hypothetical protein
MADSKISALPAATVALAGTEVLPIVQSSTTKQVSVANLTAGRAISATQITLTTGNVIVASGQGIDFSATAGTGTSELLNDYEEGTFTPSYTGSTTNPTVAYSTQEGIYTKVGRLVTFKIILVTTSSSGGSGTLGVTGLPFTVSSGAGGSMQFSFAFSTPVLQAIPSGTSINLYDAYAGTTNSQPTVLALTGAGGSTFLQFVGQYFV